MITMAKVGLVVALVSMSAVAGAKSSATGARSVRIHNMDRYDKSKDFSLHFDQEVRSQRGHPSDDDSAPRRASHRRSRGMR